MSKPTIKNGSIDEIMRAALCATFETVKDNSFQNFVTDRLAMTVLVRFAANQRENSHQSKFWCTFDRKLRRNQFVLCIVVPRCVIDLYDLIDTFKHILTFRPHPAPSTHRGWACGVTVGLSALSAQQTSGKSTQRSQGSI